MMPHSYMFLESVLALLRMCCEVTDLKRDDDERVKFHFFKFVSLKLY